MSYENEIAKLVPQYVESFTNLSNAYINSCNKMTESSIAIGREIAESTVGPGRIPTSLVMNAGDTVEAYTRVAEIAHKAVLASLDTAKQNIEVFSENIATFTKVNLNLMKIWQSLYTPSKA